MLDALRPLPKKPDPEEKGVYEKSLLEHSKFSASVSQLFDAKSLENIVNEVETGPQLNREEHLRQLRIRAGLISQDGTSLRDYYTQSSQIAPAKAQARTQPPPSFTGSLPSLNTAVFHNTLPKTSGLFGSFMTKAQNAAVGVIKQANAVAEAAKQAVSDATTLIIDEQPKSTVGKTSKLQAMEANLPELTPPTPDNQGGRLEDQKQINPSLLIPGDYIAEDERKAARRAWHQSSSVEDDGDENDRGREEVVECFQETDEAPEEQEDDRSRWIQPCPNRRQNRVIESDEGSDEAWLNSRDSALQEAMKARDRMLMAAATGIHHPLVNGQDYYEQDETSLADGEHCRPRWNVDDGTDDDAGMPTQSSK